ncbi:sugar transferase [Pararhodobacter aggregans]|uniref:Sugar transferase n=1 Tax=Pararhodobacter aggregans TaxID=404875 RepID=A0A2T7UX55_9RHOB|nr:sugar transferase [Pararhodobacter aggregans]PTX04939.1 lipopolysaccharide/colanic/teichoic acid biosynthesis glycosyltransferase [Pararhodobacter aggregans]PVE49262.1 sugar transferase [Pararhodobacter aggregans]
MTPAKRAFDLWTAAMITPFVAPMILVIALVILLRDGRPIFHAGERMRTPTQGFRLWKFRTMRVDPADTGASGGHKAPRITPTGRWLRRRRLDELPQLWNLWRGDISVVGPRPPLRLYVERFPDLYGEVLKSRPGLTGLATIAFARHEERLLARTRTAEETEAIYGRTCAPRKARIDLIYQRNRSFCFDLNLVRKTLFPSAR